MTKYRKSIEDLFYMFILIPLIYIALSVVWQAIKFPEEIPNIFGYKLFMILDKDMENVQYGDLVFTKNININELNDKDIIAIREVSNNNVRFIKYNQTKNLPKIEGLLIKRIPKIGSTLYFIQKPVVMITISLIILIVGGIWIFIAGKLDERDLNKQSTEKN